VPTLVGWPVTLTSGDFFACRRVRRGGSPASVSHLLVAADVLSPGYENSSYIAVCGVEVDPDSPTTVEVEEDPRYCPVCVRAAVRWSSRRVGR
jgi:hypothetical protein